jgi:hypothetical protein
MNVLTQLQLDFLHSFFAQPASAPFALHGGTALAAFHLRHRVSEDIDLFAVAPLGDEELKAQRDDSCYEGPVRRDVPLGIR